MDVQKVAQTQTKIAYVRTMIWGQNMCARLCTLGWICYAAAAQELKRQANQQRITNSSGYRFWIWTRFSWAAPNIVYTLFEINVIFDTFEHVKQCDTIFKRMRNLVNYTLRCDNYHDRNWSKKFKFSPISYVAQNTISIRYTQYSMENSKFEILSISVNIGQILQIECEKAH